MKLYIFHHLVFTPAGQSDFCLCLPQYGTLFYYLSVWTDRTGVLYIVKNTEKSESVLLFARKNVLSKPNNMWTSVMKMFICENGESVLSLYLINHLSHTV